jgi:tripartite-type tricarboxylate transporter receptor subunit TctC
VEVGEKHEPRAHQGCPDQEARRQRPFAAGGPTDVLGRVIAQRMSEIMGQQVMVENVAPTA